MVAPASQQNASYNAAKVQTRQHTLGNLFQMRVAE